MLTQANEKLFSFVGNTKISGVIIISQTEMWKISISGDE